MSLPCTVTFYRAVSKWNLKSLSLNDPDRDPAPPQLIVVSSSSIVYDEDAMMEAPTTAEASSSVQTDGIVTPG